MNAGRNQKQWWWTAATFALLGTGLMYMHLSQKIDDLQKSFYALDARTVLTTGTQAENNHTFGAVASPGARLSQPSPAGYDTMDAVNRIRQLKQQKSSIDPVTRAADLNNRMAREPALPKIEQQHSSWLNETLQRMPADAPAAASLQTNCEGRRCLVSAVFASEDDAMTWGRRYLLEGGGRMLEHSRTVIVPFGGTNPSVALQLYLY